MLVTQCVTLLGGVYMPPRCSFAGGITALKEGFESLYPTPFPVYSLCFLPEGEDRNELPALAPAMVPPLPWTL